MIFAPERNSRTGSTPVFWRHLRRKGVTYITLGGHFRVSNNEKRRTSEAARVERRKNRKPRARAGARGELAPVEGWAREHK